MSLFQEMLKSGESLFRDTLWLSYEFQPKILYGRENEQQRFAAAVKPLLEGRNGRNLFVYGAPGIGKTTACRHVLRELQDTTDEVIPIYVNCWKENTTFKIFYKICQELGYKYIVNQKSTDLFAMIQQKVNKKSVVFVFDEVDKVEEHDFLYAILEEVYRKSIILITNYRDSYSEFDERVRSRFSPEFLFFRQYNEAEIREILAQRRDFAFVQQSWDEDAFHEIVEKCTELRDCRIGLYLMQEAGNLAEERSSRRITIHQVADAMKKVDDFHIKPADGLEPELQQILNLVRDNTGKKIGDIYSCYAETGGDLSYKSFVRRITKLQEGRFISAEKVASKEGNTTMVSYATDKKLSEFEKRE